MTYERNRKCPDITQGFENFPAEFQFTGCPTREVDNCKICRHNRCQKIYYCRPEISYMLLEAHEPNWVHMTVLPGYGLVGTRRPNWSPF